MTRDGDTITFDYSDDCERAEVVSMMPFIDLLAFVASLPCVAVVVGYDERCWEAVKQGLRALEDQHDALAFFDMVSQAGNEKEVE